MPTVRSFADRISFTASFCPVVSGPLLRCSCTSQPRMSARPWPSPSRIWATVSRSSPTVRSVASESSAPGMFTACSTPSRSRAATARSASSMLTAPGAWASTAANRSARENTAARSERCAIAQAAASAAREGAASDAVSRSGVCASSNGTPVWETVPPGSGNAGGASRVALPGAGAGSTAVCRTGESDISTACDTSELASRPRSAACFRQTPHSSSRSMSRLAARVISAARSARRGLSPEVPRLRSAIAASISARRVEKASMAARGTPAISKRPSAWVFSMP